jgi:hypothetical protein
MFKFDLSYLLLPLFQLQGGAPMSLLGLTEKGLGTMEPTQTDGYFAPLTTCHGNASKNRV